jgi:hypothetical protein
MKSNFNERQIQKAAEVANYLMHLSQEFPERWNKVIKKYSVGIPFGDLVYGAALSDWEMKNKHPEDVTFSYKEGNVEDPFLIEFREELSQRFGMRILTIEEGKERIRTVHKITKVHDWGSN